MHETLVTIDPGIATGFAFKIGDRYETLVIHATEPYGVYDMIYKQPFKLVAVETFQTSSLISRYGLRTTEIVGAVEALCWACDIPCVRRTPQHRIPFLHKANIMLKDQKVVTHQIDALAHLLSLESSIEKGSIKFERPSEASQRVHVVDEAARTRSAGSPNLTSTEA